MQPISSRTASWLCSLLLVGSVFAAGGNSPAPTIVGFTNFDAVVGYPFAISVFTTNGNAATNMWLWATNGPSDATSVIVYNDGDATNVWTWTPTNVCLTSVTWRANYQASATGELVCTISAISQPQPIPANPTATQQFQYVKSSQILLSSSLAAASGTSNLDAFVSWMTNTYVTAAQARSIVSSNLAVVSTSYQNYLGSNSLPVGTVTAFGGTNAPTYWMECNGAWLSPSSNATLYAAISTNYGLSNGFFRIPDYRSYFLRGWAHGTSGDPYAGQRFARGDGKTGDVVGTWQASSIGAHSHSLSWKAFSIGSGSGSYVALNAGQGTTVSYGNTDNNSPSYNESRPANVSVMWIIRIQ